MTDLHVAAREALEAMDKALFMNDTGGLQVTKHNEPLVSNALEKLRNAIAAQPAQEPASYTLEQIADAAHYAEIPDSKLESMQIALGELH